jgi:hypothetical protein
VAGEQAHHDGLHVRELAVVRALAVVRLVLADRLERVVHEREIALFERAA